MSGFIFLCDSNTETECLKRLLIGTNNSKIYSQAFSQIKIGDLCFLYNYKTGLLRGVYKALTQCKKNLEPNAWSDSGTSFPFQVRISSESEYINPISVDDIRNLIKFSPWAGNLVPPSIISNEEIKNILKKFKQNNDDNRPLESRFDESKDLTSSYILKCDKITGSKCFSDNIMGAPVGLFRNIISKIQPGSIIFVWQIEEKRLYGIWRALSRGQYDPTAFDSRFPAIVICERRYNLEKGISAEQLRGIVPFDDKYPPYKISHKKGQQLIEALIKENSGAENYISQPKFNSGEYTSEDGHIVKSLSEAFIDNWLFNHNLLHAYEYRVQLNNKFLKCDFYLPVGNVYIEFWGLAGKPDYDERRKAKREIYKKANKRLLELFPGDICILPEVLPAKLASFGIATS
jgi:hypothetical protein